MQISNYIEELRHTVTVSSLNYEIWWVYKGKDTRPEFIDVMNDYSIFFQTSIHAHFVSLLVGLYRLYENRPDTYNITKLLELIRNHPNFSGEVMQEITGIYEEAKPLWLKVRLLRNKAFGHRCNAHTVEEVFKEAAVSPDNLKDLLELTKKLLNAISHAYSRNTHAFNLGAREDIINLLNDLKRLRN